MKLRLEKHPDIDRLSECLHEIEGLADSMGIPVDELGNDAESNGLKIMHKRRRKLLDAQEENLTPADKKD